MGPFLVIIHAVRLLYIEIFMIVLLRNRFISFRAEMRTTQMRNDILEWFCVCNIIYKSLQQYKYMTFLLFSYIIYDIVWDATALMYI